MKIVLSFSLFLIFLSSNLFSQNVLEGKWNGFISIQGQKLLTDFEIRKSDSSYAGSLDIPQQGAFGLPLIRAEMKSDSVFLEFNAGPNVGKFAGLISDKTIKGNYSQGMLSTPFEIIRGSDLEEEISTNSVDMILQNGDINIGGTLQLPRNGKNFPLVILLSGSGAQERNSNVFGFKVFEVLANELADNGIASFRMDDRGIGESTGNFNNATLEDLTSDVNAAIETLSNDENNSFSQIIVLGHSQGGIVAGKIGTESSKVDKVILMASTGLDLKTILRFQVEQAYGEGRFTEEDIEKEISLREGLMETIRDGGDVNAASENYSEHYFKMLEGLPKSETAQIPDLRAYAILQTNQLKTFFSVPQYQSLLFYDPLSDLEKLNKPTLVLFGDKDTQVPVDMNLEPIENALKKSGSNYQVKVFENGNHLFQVANTGQVTEYQALEKAFVPDFAKTIIDWINQK